MNLLILTPHLPYPARQGTAIRNFNLISHLAQWHTVDLLTFLAADEEWHADNPLHALCRRVATVPQPERSTPQRLRDTFLSPLPDMALRLASPHMHAAISRWLEDGDYDVVQSEGIEMARYGMQAGRRRGIMHVFDDHNCEYLLQKRNAITDLAQPRRWPAALYSVAQWQKLLRYEGDIVRASDAVAAVSEADAHALRALCPAAPVTIVRNGIDLDYYTPASETTPPMPADGRRRLVFTGKMDYRPNIDAVLWFARHVLPRVTAQAPDVRFQIVGRNPHARLAPLLANPAVEITGAVDDVRPYIQQGAVFVIPMRIGGGTRFKALEAMACARPVVSTRLGVEGIAVQNGSEMLLADTADAFADAVLTLLEPANLLMRNHFSKNARQFVEANYGWPPIVEKLNAMYDRLNLHTPATPSHLSPSH